MGALKLSTTAADMDEAIGPSDGRPTEALPRAPSSRWRGRQRDCVVWSGTPNTPIGRARLTPFLGPLATNGFSRLASGEFRLKNRRRY
jgi:hypothetical protein